MPLGWLDNKDGEISMIIHAGDISSRGYKQEIIEFLDWYSKLPFSYKIFTPGNHDFFFEKAKEEEIKELLALYPNVTYLNDSGCEIEGIKIWGSPISPFFFDWAFNRYRGKDIQKHWDLIPHDINILCTHTPVYGLCDMTPSGEFVGCEDLLNTVVTKLNDCMLHICGHIHSAHGFAYKHGKTFINTSILNERYMVAYKPIIIEFNKEKKEARIIE